MNWNKKIPFIYALLLALATLFIGSLAGWYALRSKQQNSYKAPLDHVLGLIERHYVEKVDMHKLARGLIPAALSELDPHSEYIPREESISETQRLEGAFYGVGITFNTVIDTPVVISVIDGGPASRAGIQAGDRLLKANGKNLVSSTDSISDEKVKELLSGEKGSLVKLEIKRKELTKEIKVVRDEVPIHSVDVAYMLDSETGLIRINSWARNTHQEFISEYARLHKQGLRKLILDLRDNAGGYFVSSIALANEFLPKENLIVYSQGNDFPKEEYHADGSGILTSLPLVILINELTASSSEIFAGAMQDHDRAKIVGRRSFGKGLVQRPYFLPDSSQIRLTVAKYYTPSGRCIQKKYNMGEKESYSMDLYMRYTDGEMYKMDSAIFKDAPQFKTDKGRIVYGDNGIVPDVFVPLKEKGVNAYYIRLVESGLIPKFTFRYADKHRNQLNKFTTIQELWNYFQQNEDLPKAFAVYASENGIEQRPGMLYESHELLNRILAAQVAQNIFGVEGFYRIFHDNDVTIKVAQEELNKI